MAFRASLKVMVLPILELWVHDEWISFASSIHGIRGIPIQAPLVYYRQHQDQALGLQPRDPLYKRACQYFRGEPQAYEFYELALRKWRAAYTLLKSKDNQIPTGLPVLQWLEAKVAHVTLRAKLYQQPRRTRIIAILGELTRGRYHLYSDGWRSASRDLLLPLVGDSDVP
jgi:hypothetical protein